MNKKKKRQWSLYLVFISILLVVFCFKNGNVYALNYDRIVKEIEIDPIKNILIDQELLTETVTQATTVQETEATTQPVTTEEPTTEQVTEEVTEDTESTTEEYYWDDVLNSVDGVANGPSGPETFYNLDMSGCIDLMKAIKENPDSDEYIACLSEDKKQVIIDNINSLISFEETKDENGAKRIGQYIMCAADLRIRPKGTILQTSLGLAMVVDTGSFAETAEPTTKLDIAVSWENE